MTQDWAAQLEEALGPHLRLKRNEPLARYTSARVGGPAEVLVAVETSEELAEAARTAWRLGVQFRVLGGGSNVLVADAGVRGLVILNRAKAVEFREQVEGQGLTIVHAESGCSLGSLARQCVQAGLAGLEWAATVPGTVGGAVYGNAGAHGSDVAASLELAAILHHEGTIRNYGVRELGLGYRTSGLKEQGSEVGDYLGMDGAVVLSADFRVTKDEVERVQARVDEFVSHRKRTQPPGASIGSMFKNPAGDYAGRLIESAGLKGTRVGGAKISNVHANFFVNDGQATAAEVKGLLDLARETVVQKFGVELETEVELIGDW